MPAVFLTLQSRVQMLFYNTLVIFCFIQFSLNSSISYRSRSILIENISIFPEWTFSVRFNNSIKFSSVPGCKQRWPTRPLLVFHSSILYKTQYIVGSGCLVSRAIAGPFSTALIAFFSDRQLNTFWCHSKELKFVNKADDPELPLTFY